MLLEGTCARYVADRGSSGSVMEGLNLQKRFSGCSPRPLLS